MAVAEGGCTGVEDVRLESLLGNQTVSGNILAVLAKRARPHLSGKEHISVWNCCGQVEADDMLVKKANLQRRES